MFQAAQLADVCTCAKLSSESVRDFHFFPFWVFVVVGFGFVCFFFFLLCGWFFYVPNQKPRGYGHDSRLSARCRIQISFFFTD